MGKLNFARLFSRSISLFIFFSASVMVAGNLQVLSPEWQYQDAVNSATMPRPDAWQKSLGAVRSSSGMKTDDCHNIWLKQDLFIAENCDGRRYLLDFEVINGNAIVWVNGKRVGERLGPYGKIEISPFVIPGKNELLIFNTRNYTDISRQEKDDYLRSTARGTSSVNPLPYSKWQLGIPREVNLISLPRPAALTDACAITSWRKKELTIRLELDADKIQNGVQISCDIFDADNKKVMTLRSSENLQPGINHISLTSAWKDPVTWELDRGYMYTARIELKDSTGILLDKTSFPFGFREVWTEGTRLMMNGHPCRWRTDWEYFGLNEASVSFFKLYGRNMIYFQSNPTAWWQTWPLEVMHVKQDDLDLLDREGIAVLMPVPTCNYIGEQLIANPEAQKQYRNETEVLIRRYRRHPSIIAWCTAMNSLNPRDSIAPETLGKRQKYTQAQGKVLDKSYEIVKELDPSRLVYAHADGNSGDIANGNVYPNFTPVQEVADYPELWAKHGDMPWFAAEYAAVYNGSYFKGKAFLMTEYAAIFFGENAYRMETPEQLASTLKIGIESTKHGSIINQYSDILPMRWEIEKLYVAATDRSWRTWGVSGWHYFNFGYGYGNPPESGGRNLWQYRYKIMRNKVSERPSWANIQFDMYSKYMQPFLAYIAGDGTHTDKTHSYFCGEPVKKNIAVVWDGPGQKTVNLNWKFVTGGKCIASGKYVKSFNAGDIEMLPVSFAAPEVEKRSAGVLELSVDGKDTDTFAIQIFPKVPEVKIKRKVFIFDPSGKSLSWIKARIPDVSSYTPGDKLTANDILIIGRQAVKNGDSLPFRLEDVKKGMRVLLLEQTPDIWERLGFRVVNSVPRQVFPGTSTGILMDGLESEDLAFWRGSPNIIPEYRCSYGSDVPMAPKGSNRHGVASTVLEIPVVKGFRPLLHAEFDMAYSPLLEMPYGNGDIIFSTLDFSDRVGTDPAATTLASNLIKYLDDNNINNQQIITVYDPAKQAKEIDSALRNGDTIIYTALDHDSLKKIGISSGLKDVRNAGRENGTFATKIPQNLLRWRDKLRVNAITSDSKGGEICAGGIILSRKNGKSSEIFVQVSPEMMEKIYAGDSVKKDALELSTLRLKQLIARIATEAGAQADEKLVGNIHSASNSSAFDNINSWFLFGPFYPGQMSPEQKLQKVYPGETQALSGDMNPNLTYNTPDGHVLDFRRTSTTDSDGFLDIASSYGDLKADTLCYAISHINSDKDRKAMLRFGFDYFGRVYLNGQTVFEVSSGHSAPEKNKFKVRINLKKGENTLVVKVLPGSKGFGLWANISQAGAELTQDGNENNSISLYDRKIKIRSPYEYVYW